MINVYEQCIDVNWSAIYPTFKAYIPSLTNDDAIPNKLHETLYWKGFEATNVCLFQQKSPIN